MRSIHKRLKAGVTERALKMGCVGKRPSFVARHAIYVIFHEVLCRLCPIILVFIYFILYHFDLLFKSFEPCFNVRYFILNI